MAAQVAAMAAQAGAEALGKIVSGFGQWQQSRVRAAALKVAAKQARGEAAQDAQLAVDEMERAGARAAVTGAASGGGFGGSFAGALEDLERTGMFNARSAIYGGNVEAKNRLYEAKVAKAEGTMALIGSIVGASSTIGGDYMRQAEQRKQQAAKRDFYRRGYGR